MVIGNPVTVAVRVIILEHDMRFSDEQLQNFYDSWNAHKIEVNGYIEKFDKHIDKEETRWDELMQSVEDNTALYAAQREATQKLVDLYKTGESGIKLLSWVGKFAKWLSGLAIFIALYHFVVEHFASGRPPP